MALTKSESEIREGLPGLMPRLWRYAMVLSSDRSLAEELVQATALRALERAGQFQPGSRLDHWSFAILSSIWKNDLRARKVRLGAGHVPVEEVELSDTKSDPEVNILARQVLSLMSQLPDAQRETLFLVYVEGFSYAEAAERLDIPIGTVMSRLANGRKRLKTVMDDSPDLRKVTR